MKLPPEAIDAFGGGLAGAVLNALAADGHEARIVGGAVRDALMGRPIREIDVATTAVPERTAAALEAAGLRSVPTGIAHGTVTAVRRGESVEITTLRRDVTTDGRRAAVEFGTDWREDALRRDFTINALSVDRDGTVHDPVGGLDDVFARRLRFIGDPRRRIAEDRLRAWRFLRFFAEIAEGPPDGPGLSAVAAARPTMGLLSAERVAHELRRLLRAPRAVEAAALAAETGLLIDVVGVPRLGTFARVAGCDAADAAERLAALAAHLPEDALRIGERLRLSNAERDRMALLATCAPGLADAPRRTLAATGSAYPAVCRLAWALSTDPGDDPAWTARRDLPERDPVPPFPVRGADLIALGVPAGPTLGGVLGELRRIWAEGDYRAGRDELIARVARLAGSGDLGDLGRGLVGGR